ncbi:MAG: hypothetical protein ABI426_08180 [Flavobacterium sp.]
MRKINLVIALFFSASLLAQTKPLNIKIDAITSEESDSKKRTYLINYHIENITDHPVSFFLYPNSLIANAASSMTLFPIYKIYQNNDFIALDGPFYEQQENEEWNRYLEMKDKKSAEAKELLKKITVEFEIRTKTIVENYKKMGGTKTDEHWILQNNHLLKTEITLSPKETRSFTIKTYWDKERYFLQDDLEYYLDEKDRFEFELVVDLKKTFFKDRLSPEEFGKIEKDKNFIEGTFTSNKVNITF